MSSEDEPVQPFGQKLKVTVSRSPEIENLQEQLSAMKSEKETLENELSTLASQEFDKKKSELKEKTDSRLHESIDAINSPSELEQFQNIYDTLRSDGSETPKSKPSGIVTLPQKGEVDITRKAYDRPEDMIGDLFSKAKTDPNAEEMLNQLFSKRLKSGKYELTEPQPRVKSSTGRYCQYTSPRTGNSILIPEDHAKRLSPEMLQKRLESGFYE